MNTACVDCIVLQEDERGDVDAESAGDASVATDSELERVISSAAAAVEEFSHKLDEQGKGD